MTDTMTSQNIDLSSWGIMYIWRIKKQLDATCHLFYFLETQHDSSINMPIFRSLRLCRWTTTLAVSFLICCVLGVNGAVRLG